MPITPVLSPRQLDSLHPMTVLTDIGSGHPDNFPQFNYRVGVSLCGSMHRILLRTFVGRAYVCADVGAVVSITSWSGDLVNSWNLTYFI
jgi:hypothetical protein